MNKKDLAAFRKEFKDESYKLNLKEIYSAYMKKEDGEIIHKEINYFDSFELDKKELYFNNFKKILSSSIDTKSFELEFNNDIEDSTQKVLYRTLNEPKIVDLETEINLLISKIKENYKYENDIIITFVKGSYYQSNRKANVEAEEAVDDAVNELNFILCSINKVEIPKRNLIFDYENRQLIPNSSLEVVINLNSPLEGFVFPAFENGYTNVNKILYYTAKAKELNLSFIENVLNCKEKLTAEDEKEQFHNILATVVGDHVKPEIIQDIYTKMSEIVEEDEEKEMIGVNDVKNILLSSGLENVETLETAFEENCGTKYDFRIQNIIPDTKSKSIKISCETAEITINPKDLSMVKQIKDKSGKKCLLIEINEDVVVNGLTLATEEDF
jgi:hypothetical protein